MKNLRIKSFLILLTFFFNVNLYGQCDFCGTYENKYNDRIQILKIKSDLTFEYEFNGIFAGLMGGNTSGTWIVDDDKLILNSKYSNKDYTIIEDKVNHCQTNLDSFLNSKCDSLIRINIKNLNNEDIWHLKDVMINNDTSQISTIVFENLSQKNNYTTAAFFINSKISSVLVFNGWYEELEINVTNHKSNDITIKGNFSDIPWYTYFVNEEWKLRKKKLVGNKNFGNFKQKNNTD